MMMTYNQDSLYIRTTADVHWLITHEVPISNNLNEEETPEEKEVRENHEGVYLQLLHSKCLEKDYNL